MRKFLVATSVAILTCSAAEAATVPASGYLYAREVLPELTEGCIAHAPGGVFVGVGPALSFPAPGKTRDIVFVAESGAIHTVATGLNAIGDCVYDGAGDVLYVTDSGAEFSGATTGDTVFAIPGTSVAVPVDGLEVIPAGSLPFAFSIDVLGSDLLVTDAAGGGAGTVVAVDLSGGPSTSLFASGFDYTGGVLVDGARVLVAESFDPTFDSAVHEYSTAGVFQSTLSGPTYNHGSTDLALSVDAEVIATGLPTIATVDGGGAATPLVTGLDGGTGFDAFGGGVSVDAFTGRIDFLASSFTGADDDRSVHRLVPIDRLVPGGRDRPSECAVELYGVELVPRKPGRPARLAICEDGAPCDADGQVDGGCTFPLGLCFNVIDDPRLPSCGEPTLDSVELLRAKPEGSGAEALFAAAAAAMPAAASTCVFGDGVRVPLRLSGSGEERRGKGLVKLRAQSSDASVRGDRDRVKMFCEPSTL